MPQEPHRLFLDSVPSFIIYQFVSSSDGKRSPTPAYTPGRDSHKRLARAAKSQEFYSPTTLAYLVILEEVEQLEEDLLRAEQHRPDWNVDFDRESKRKAQGDASSCAEATPRHGAAALISKYRIAIRGGILHKLKDGGPVGSREQYIHWKSSMWQGALSKGWQSHPPWRRCTELEVSRP